MGSWTDTEGSLWVDVPLDRLSEYADPYRMPPWWDCGRGDVTIAAVLRAAAEGRVQALPYDDSAPGPHGARFHVERIAWFVADPARLVWNPDDREAPELDVGISSLGYMPKWIVLAGNHRYAAGLALGLPTLPFVVSGCLDDAEEMFGVRIKTPLSAAQ